MTLQISRTRAINTACIAGYDVVIVAGQSNNLAGLGKDAVLDNYGPRIFQYGRREGENSKIIPAVEPLQHHNVSPNRKYIGYVGIFTKKYRDANLLEKDRCILILPAAKGGSSFSKNEWNPGDIYAEDLILRANKIMSNKKNKLIALFWHQGESDATATPPMGKDIYIQTWLSLINAFNSRITGFNKSTPIFIGQMVPSWIRTKGEAAENINAAHKALTVKRANTFFISAENPVELGLNDEANLGFKDQPIHYSATSQREFGKRYFNRYKTLLENGTITRPELPKLKETDFNKDGKTDAKDYLILRNNFDTKYDIFDYNLLVANYRGS